MRQWEAPSNNTPSLSGFAFLSNIATTKVAKAWAISFRLSNVKFAYAENSDSKALAQTLSETSNDRITRRTIADERQAIEEADKTFRLIEQQSPLRLKRFSREELWEAVYLGHRQNANVAPILPNRPSRDVRDYLSLETIAGEGNFVMHGNYPAAVVSLFVPPQPNIFADCMRVLTTNPALNFRHTLITDYIYLDQEKARKNLDKRMRQVNRANRGTTR